MLELEGYLRSFLRDAAIFEGIGKLILLSNAHQELRLGEELFDRIPACSHPAVSAVKFTWAVRSCSPGA